MAAIRDPSLDAFLIEHRLARPDEPASWLALDGGVSSDIWRVDLPGRSICVKRALPRLKVAAEWRAPVSRNAYEWAWLEFAARVAPDAVPTLFAHDADAGLFAMGYLPPRQYPLWKNLLLAGAVDPGVAALVGDLLGRLHAASADDDELRQAFDTGASFFALRLEPYLLATAARHPALADALSALAERTAQTRRVLVHGDVSPKNILLGPKSPVLLDAECAWFGEPAFDLAFCLNHLLLKCAVRYDMIDPLLDSFAALADAYLSRVSWEAPASLEARAAALLPGLFLARIDGKSPVEYLSGLPRAQRAVRRIAEPMLRAAPERLADLARSWRRELARAGGGA